MRLTNVSSGHALKQKLILGVIRLLSGSTAPDVIKTLMYRPEYFGRPFSELLQDVMRGQGEWSIGERELFAAFTSHELACEF